MLCFRLRDLVDAERVGIENEVVNPEISARAVLVIVSSNLVSLEECNPAPKLRSRRDIKLYDEILKK